MTIGAWRIGRLFEWSVLGDALATPLEYLPFKEAMTLARNSSAWDPTDPDPRQANDFHFHLCEALGVEDYSLVYFYSALGTPLDLFHGVDCWIEFEGQIVTIDLTVNDQKYHYKADVVIYPKDLENGGKEIMAHIVALLQPRCSRR